MEEKRANFIILGILTIILLIVIIPLIIINNREENKKNFPEYKDIDISEKDVKDPNSESYKEIRKELESDYYFSKEALITDYDSEKYNGSNIQNMLWNFIFSYELENTKYMASNNKKEGTFCLSKNNTIEAFKELYDVDIKNELNILLGYYEYVYKKGNDYCFIYKNVANDYDNEITIAVERMAMIGTTVTTDIYVYEYYTNGLENEISNVNILKRYIENNNYSSASNVVTNYLNGKVTHKQLKLKVNNKGKFFKYKILSSKILEY